MSGDKAASASGNVDAYALSEISATSYYYRFGNVTQPFVDVTGDGTVDVQDLLATSLVVDPYDRQSILEEDNPLRRLKLVHVQMKNILFQIAENPVGDE